MSGIDNGRVRRPSNSHGLQLLFVHEEGTEAQEGRSPQMSQGESRPAAGRGWKPVCLPQCLFSLLILQAPGQLHPEI